MKEKIITIIHKKEDQDLIIDTENQDTEALKPFKNRKNSLIWYICFRYIFI